MVIAGPVETVGQVGHLPYHFLVVHDSEQESRLVAFVVMQIKPANVPVHSIV